MAGAAQLGLPIPNTWGGARKGAGRPRIEGRRRPVEHRARPRHATGHPVHVTMRARSGLLSLRSPCFYSAVVGALTVASREMFRVVHFSVQSDHLHLIVEAHDKDTLARGLLGLTIRLARKINRTLDRSGPVWGDRYHARALPSPREVRNAIVYVLFNFKKHRPADRRRLDPCSTARWFDGFREPVPSVREPPPAAAPRTWLLRVGWRRRGLIDLDEAPAS
jgi:putative transposase